MEIAEWFTFSIPKPIRRFFEAIYRDERGRTRDRRILATIAITLAGVIYWFFIEARFPAKNVVDKVANVARTPAYDIHTGGRAGFYIKIGKHLQRSSTNSEPFTITSHTSKGSLDNIQKVGTHRRTLGLAQQNVLDLPQFADASLQRITPLYMESMHVIYNVGSYRSFFSSWRAVSPEDRGPPVGSDWNPPPLSLGSHSTEELKAFLGQARINIGGPTGGTFLLASATLDLCGITPTKLTGYAYEDAFEHLEDGSIDVVFATARAPLFSITELLGNPEIRMISIDPGLIPQLSETLGSPLHGTALSSKYPEYLERLSKSAEQDGRALNITSYGTYAILIASRDTPDPIIRRVAQKLHELDSDDLQLPQASDADEHVLDYPFLEEVEATRRSYFGDFLESAVLFFLFMGVSIGAILTFLVWSSSFFKHAEHYRELSELYAALPANTELRPRSGDLSSPRVPDPAPKDQNGDVRHGSQIVDDLVAGLSGLLDRAARIRSDAETGGITLAHQRHLLEEVATIKRLFQDNLAQRLLRAIATRDVAVSQDELLDYVTAGYVRREQFDDLSRRLRARPESKLL